MFKQNNNSGNSSNGGVNENLKKMVDITIAKATAFIKQFYYPLYDTERLEVLNLYKDPSISIWNGTECQGLETIRNLLSEIPKSSHTIETFDCQPVQSFPNILAEDIDNPNILITVTGKVLYGTVSTHNFHQTFLLVKDPTNPQSLYISYDCIRLTS